MSYLVDHDCVIRCRCRSGSLPSIGEAETTVASSSSSIIRGQLVTMSSSSSSSRQSNDSAYDSSPRPTLALRHLIRPTAHPSHVTVRTESAGSHSGCSGSRRPARCLHLATIPASVATGGALGHVPVPLSTASPAVSIQQRLGSAQRFRDLVLKCRDTD